MAGAAAHPPHPPSSTLIHPSNIRRTACYRFATGFAGTGQNEAVRDRGQWPLRARKCWTTQDAPAQNETGITELQNRCSTAELTRHIKDLASEPAFCHRIAIARK
jgi:hypothetical protein